MRFRGVLAIGIFRYRSRDGRLEAHSTPGRAFFSVPNLGGSWRNFRDQLGGAFRVAGRAHRTESLLRFE
jgi:hypothetical protein